MAPADPDKAARMQSVRRKLEKLNRGPLKLAPVPAAVPELPPRRRWRLPPEPGDDHPATRLRTAQPAPSGPVVYRRDRPALPARRLGPPPPAAGAVAPLEQCVPGDVCRDVEGLPFYRIEQPVQDPPDLAARLRAALARPLPPGSWPAGIPLNAVAFLELETAGLGSAPLFLIGLVAVDDADRPVCRQLFARHYAEERSVLRYFAAIARILKHNLHDLVTLAVLLARLADPADGPADGLPFAPA